MKEINSTTKAVPLTLSYDTITLRKFRMWIHIQAVIYSLKHFGKSFNILCIFPRSWFSFTANILYLVLIATFPLSNYFNIIIHLNNVILIQFQDFQSKDLMKLKPCLLRPVFTFWFCQSWCQHSM